MLFFPAFAIVIVAVLSILPFLVSEVFLWMATGFCGVLGG
jgi:hypothetical protein